MELEHLTKVAEVLECYASELDEREQQQKEAKLMDRVEKLSPLIDSYETSTGEKLSNEQKESMLTSEDTVLVDMLTKISSTNKSSPYRSSMVSAQFRGQRLSYPSDKPLKSKQ